MFMKKLHEFCNKKNFKKNNSQEKFGHGTEATVPSKPEKLEFVAKPPPDVRLILFRECKETSNRNILFDSKSIQKTRQKCGMRSRQGNEPQQTPLPQYQVVNESKDWHVLGEMLFGTVGMASKATSLKIHLMKDPPTLMLSRVYSDTSAKDVSTPSLERGLDAFKNNSLSSRRAKTLPLATPDTPTTHQLPSPTVAHSLTNSLTRLARSDSSTSILSVFGSLGTPVMRVPNAQSTTRAHSLPQTARNTNKDTFMFSDEFSKGVSPRKAKIKIGLAIVLLPEPSTSHDFNKFVFNHFPIIESYMTRLKEEVENALNFVGRRTTSIEKFDFISTMMTALHQFTEHLTDLYCTPRLIEPMWNTLTVKSDIPWRGDPSAVECLISDIANLYRHNNRNNFINTLISAVLTYHLGWVSTVGTSSPEEVNNREMVNYNPLWAQLGDVYGAMCSPTRVSKTIVTGSDHQKVSTIVSMLSYLIRCARVEEALTVPDILEPQNVLSYEHNIDMKEVNGEKAGDGFILISSKQSSEMTSSNKSLAASLTSISSEKKKKQTNLHRSRSSPFGASQYNNGSDSHSSLHRNPSDTLCRSRFVQSRRKSNNCVNPIRFTISSDTIEMPSSLNNVHEENEIRSSFPSKNSLRNETKNSTIKTHKRVNSEPFKIHSTPSHEEQQGCSSPCKVVLCKDTFVGHLEPKVERMIHVQSDVSLARRNIKENIPPATHEKSRSDVNCNTIHDDDQMLRRNSSGKSKIAKRRHPLLRTPSVQLNHEDFVEYFDDKSELPNINEINKATESLQTKAKPARPAPPLPSRPPVHKGSIYPPIPKVGPVTAGPPTIHKPTPPKIPTTGPVGDPARKPIYPILPPVQSPPRSIKPIRPNSLFQESNSHVKKIYPVLPPVVQATPASLEERGSVSDEREEWPLTNIHKNILKPNNSNFGYSNLMADYSPKYLWNFALFGARPMLDITQSIAEELEHAVKRPVLDETVAESVCVHADVDRNTVSVYSSHRLHSGQIALPALSSKLVANMIERVVRLHAMKVPADFCLMQLESELTQLVLKSRMLAEYVQGQTRVAVTDLSKVLGIEKHDLPLLMAIASCHSPQVGAVI